MCTYYVYNYACVSCRHHAFRATVEQRHQGLGQIGEAQLRGDRRTATAQDPMVHERGAGGRKRGRRQRSRREKVQAPADGQTVPVAAQERTRVPAAHQQAGGARHGIFHVRGHQRHRKDTVHRHSNGQNQSFQ